MIKDSTFFENIAYLIEQTRKYVGRTIDLAMCITYFEIGRKIVEEEQRGDDRAKYGEKLINELSLYLTAKYKRGFSTTNLKNARRFYLIYSSQISQSMTDFLGEQSDNQKNQLKNNLLAETNKFEKNMEILKNFFRISWTHYVILIRIKNDAERKFYEIETINQNWTVRQLQRQYNSSYYERIILANGKPTTKKLSIVGHEIESPQDMLKEPLVLEFLGLRESHFYSETDLETAIINKLSDFLLELGKGFLFEARQKRFSFEEEHFFVDLVFYNRLLQCYVLIDLKTDKLKHQDLGQMQMYVNYFNRFVKKDFEKPTVGILLCKEKKDSIVELTLPENANIYASEYSLYLPEKSLLQKKLAEWVAEYETVNIAENLDI